MKPCREAEIKRMMNDEGSNSAVDGRFNIVSTRASSRVTGPQGIIILFCNTPVVWRNEPV